MFIRLNFFFVFIDNDGDDVFGAGGGEVLAFRGFRFSNNYFFD